MSLAPPIDSLRQHFAVLADVAYLNAGTNGPVPDDAAAACAAEAQRESREGRSGSQHWARLNELTDHLREAFAGLLGAPSSNVALTRSTTDGVDTVLRGLELKPGTTILTSDQEHAGLLGPLAGFAANSGVAIKQAPFDRIVDHIEDDTGLIAVSHVSWMTGRVAPLAELALAEAPLLVDGAQAVGAVEVDVATLGCDFYAGSGQKWLCGPSGSGVLFVRDEWIDHLGAPAPRYGTLDPDADPLLLKPRAAAQRFDSGEVPGPSAAWLAASLDLFERFGWARLRDHALNGARAMRDQLATKVEPIERDDTTLVSFVVDGDPQAVAARLETEGVVVRPIPGTTWLRASFGAWNCDEDAERLVAAL